MESTTAIPKNRWLYQCLLAAIRAGEWNATGLPGERALAEHYGVSRCTVRRALSDLHSGGVLAIQHGRRSRVADPKLQRLRFLWLGRNDINHEQPVMVQLYDALVRLIEAHSASLTCWRMQGDQGDEWLREHLQEYDGIVLSDISGNCVLPEFAARLRAFGNVVAAQQLADNPAAVTCCTDDYTAGMTAAAYLYRVGFERVAVIGISPGLSYRHFHERVRGFADYCLDHANPALDCRMVFSEKYEDFHQPEALLRRLRLVENRIQALFVLSDFMALRCIEALKHLGLRVPEDISVLGCDNLIEGASAPVPLTTIAYPISSIAGFIWHTLTANIGIRIRVRPELKIFPPEIIERKSVKPLKNIN